MSLRLTVPENEFTKGSSDVIVSYKNIVAAPDDGRIVTGGDWTLAKSTYRRKPRECARIRGLHYSTRKHGKKFEGLYENHA